MTKPLRLIVLAALTAFVVGALPAVAFAVPCDSSEDCGGGMRCAKKKANKPGVCVSTSAAAKSAAANPCETSKDCAAGSMCSHKYKGKAGVCVGAPKAKAKSSVHRIPCDESQDCAVGSRCDHKPGKPGFCVGTGAKK
jgi:hypothetical protein